MPPPASSSRTASMAPSPDLHPLSQPPDIPQANKGPASLRRSGTHCFHTPSPPACTRFRKSTLRSAPALTSRRTSTALTVPCRCTPCASPPRSSNSSATSTMLSPTADMRSSPTSFRRKNASASPHSPVRSYSPLHLIHPIHPSPSSSAPSAVKKPPRPLISDPHPYPASAHHSRSNSSTVKRHLGACTCPSSPGALSTIPT